MNEVKHKGKISERPVNLIQKCTGEAVDSKISLSLITTSVNMAYFPETICLLHIHISVDDENKFIQTIFQK